MSFIDAVDSVVGAAAAQLVAILPSQRNIGGFIADVTVEEEHEDELEITQHPVEQGAAITDHSFKKPASVTIRAGWSNSSPQALGDPNYVQGMYAAFLALQASRQTINVVTGKRSYSNMLLPSVRLTTDKENENAMILVVRCQEIIIATTQTVSVPPSSNMQNPQINGATQNVGTQSAIANPSGYNASAASTITGGDGSSISTIPGSSPMAVFEIPFVPGQPQQMQISLNGTVYTIKVRWCDPASCWIMDLSDSSGDPILLGIPLVTGADLLAQFAYLDIGGALIVQTDNDADAVPTFANLGSEAGLYFVTPAT